MQIDPRVYLIGSGAIGFDMTNAFDCNIYLFDAGDSFVVFDAGVGMGIEEMIEICQRDGLPLENIQHLFLTHAHTDHGGGAAVMRERFALTTYAYEKTAKMVAAGDEDAVSLTPIKQAGFYGDDYVYRPCPVDHVLEDESVSEVGNLTIELIFTPGHSHDHCSYLVSGLEKTYLVSGDAIFYGGKIVLQDTYDCSVPETIASIRKLATFEFDALLPGHLNFSLKNGKRHVDAALSVIETFACPASIH